MTFDPVVGDCWQNPWGKKHTQRHPQPHFDMNKYIDEMQINKNKYHNPLAQYAYYIRWKPSNNNNNKKKKNSNEQRPKKRSEVKRTWNDDKNEA